MQLTQKQQTLIMRRLRETALALDSTLPEKTRQRALVKAKERILHRIEAHGNSTVTDAQVMDALDWADAAPPKKKKPRAAPKTRGTQTLMLAVENRRWLGVCGGIAARLGFEVWAVRALTFLLGATGPVAILLYLGLYLKMHFATDPDARPPLRLYRAFRRLAGAACIALLLHFGATYALRLLFHAHQRLLDRPVPELGSWDWFAPNAGTLLFWALFLSLPLAALSGFSLANAWDHTLKRVSQAILALYGVALSFAIASVLVGVILNSMGEFTNLFSAFEKI